MSKYFLYTHGGSFNHGCEAIVRGTIEIFKNDNRKKVLFSKNVRSERLYGVDEIIEVIPHTSYRDLNSKTRYIASALFKANLRGLSTRMANAPLINQVDKGDIGFSIGGDMYCYNNYDWILPLNDHLIRKGASLVLWGCSIEPNALNKKLIEHLMLYKMIFPRERLTEKALQASGLSNVCYMPDPAFLMKSQPIHDYDYFFEKADVIGINFSSLVNFMLKGNSTENAVKALIEYIICETKYSVALIPHVNSEANNINERDYDYMREKFYTRYLSNDRVCIISKEHNSPQLKYLISKCKAFVGSRTHATIAAYSQGIPTIVIGYSIKSRGIYFDLFDDNDDYIYSSDNNSSSLVLIEKFCQMIKNAQNIKAMLHKRVKGYKPYYDNAMEEIRLLDARNN